VVAAVLAFLFLQPPDETHFWDAAFDVGHACLFGLITFIVLHVIDTAQPGDRGWYRPGAAVALVAAAGCSEVVQRLQPTRDPSWEGVFRDVAGIACAYLLYVGAAASTQEGRFGRRLIAVGTALAIVLGAVLLPFASVVRGYAARDRVFPALSVLDGAEWERPFVRVIGGVLAPAAAGKVTRDDRGRADRLTDLLLRPGRRYVGLALDEPFPDRRGYQALVFTASIDAVIRSSSSSVFAIEATRAVRTTPSSVPFK
jgi:VanZ family protein